MTDVELDARVTALEESGGGNNQNSNKFNLIPFVSWYFTAFEMYVKCYFPDNNSIHFSRLTLLDLNLHSIIISFCLVIAIIVTKAFQ